LQEAGEEKEMTKTTKREWEQTALKLQERVNALTRENNEDKNSLMLARQDRDFYRRIIEKMLG
jgi:hypothetical protein